MSDPQPHPTEPPPVTGASTEETVEQALERARDHGRVAVQEGLRASRALLDAVSLAFYQRPALESESLAGLARGLEQLIAQANGTEAWLPLTTSLLAALDGEIDRWTQRSREQSEARAVARALMGLREVLWELGLRPAQ